LGVRPGDSVVLTGDLPHGGLKRRDVGTVVEVHPPDCAVVEFTTGAGRTLALVALDAGAFRPVGPGDILAARRVRP
jgi:hypothetical protein